MNCPYCNKDYNDPRQKICEFCGFDLTPPKLKPQTSPSPSKAKSLVDSFFEEFGLKERFQRLNKRIKENWKKLNE